MDPVLRALLAASCKARWCVLRGGGSEAGAAEDGDDLAFDLAAGDWAEVAAVLSALPVIAEDKELVFGQGHGIGDQVIVFGGGVVYVVLQHNAVVDFQCGVIGDFHLVAALGNNPGRIGHAVLFQHDHILCVVSLRQPIVQHQVPGTEPGHHVIVAHRRKPKYQPEENP